MPKAIIIGSGFAGLSAACFLAKGDWEVVVVEKHGMPGGRARQMKVEGFTFDMGPSWYWMPDVFDWFFESFGKKVSDYYQLKRLDPSYRVYWPDSYSDIAANFEELKKMFEKMEPGAGEKLDVFMKEAAYKYEVGINKLVHKPGQSLLEFVDLDLMKGLLKLDVFTSMKNHVAKYFKNPKLQELMEFPVLFLGALPQDIPALYSLMNYADVKLGTWYPQGGMYSIVQGMERLAKELGVSFLFDHNVEEIIIKNGSATGIKASDHNKKSIEFSADVVIANADYHFAEQKLLPKEFRTYSEEYWDKKVMAPSCILYYVGINKKLKNVLHHSLFFDVDFKKHGNEIYKSKEWPADPLFYVSATSVTDESAAPAGHENLFFLIPVAAGLKGDNENLRDKYFNKIVTRFEERINETIKDNIVFKKSYAVSNFVSDYNAYKGNAYGLANTLRQTAILKPSMKSRKLKNLYFTGQLTVPGPGVPPSLISGKVVAKEILKNYNKKLHPTA